MNIHFSTLITLYLFFIQHSHAGWYYDPVSCDARTRDDFNQVDPSKTSYLNVLNAAVAQAFDMVDIGRQVFGRPPPAPAGGVLWETPDSETRNLIGRVFGTLNNGRSVDSYYYVRNVYDYIWQNFRNVGAGGAGGAGANAGLQLPPDARFSLHETDIVFYCDLDRLTHSTANKKWYNARTKQYDLIEKGLTDEQYNDCKSGSTLATTDDPIGGNPTLIQICPAYIEKMSTEKYKHVDDYYNQVGSMKGKFDELCRAIKPQASMKHPFPNKQVDLYALLDVTLAHELSHAVQDMDDKTPAQQKRGSTKDVGENNGYQWKYIHRLRNGPSNTNADSYAYFALGAKFLRDKQMKITNDGCTEEIGNNYQLNAQPATFATIDSTWSGPTSKREVPEEEIDHTHSLQNISHSDEALIQDFHQTISARALQTLRVRDESSTFTATNSTNGSTSWTLSVTNTSALSSTSFASSTFTATNSTNGSASWTLSFINTSVLSPTSFATISESITDTTRSGSDSTSDSTAEGSSSLISSTIASTDQITATPSVTSISTVQSTETTLDLSQTLTTIASLTANVTNSSSTVLVQPPITSGPSTTRNITALLESFWLEQPTALPTTTELFCTNLVDCIIGTLDLESLITATDVYIPKITDISIFPNIKVKHPDGVDDDGVPEVPFVKLELPKDKCNPLPKPKSKGLLGAVLNVANKAIDTVMDAACHIELPVIKGKIPKWLNFSTFPPFDGFVPPPGDPQETEGPESTTESSSSSSSSSSCSATAVPSCKETYVVSDSVTQTFYTSCTTISACSRAGATQATVTTLSCSPTVIPLCQGTNIVSGSITKSFATDCSTITACSGTGTTSIATTVVEPTGSLIVHPEPAPSFVDHQQCALSAMEQTMSDYAAAIYSCFGLPYEATSSASLGTSLTSASTAGLTSASTAGLNSSSTAGPNSASTTGLTSLSSAGLNSSSFTGLTSLSSTGLNVSSTAGLTSLSSSELTSTLSAGFTSLPSTGLNSSSTAGLNSASTTGLTPSSSAGLTPTSSAGLNSSSSAGFTSASSAELTSASSAGLTSQSLETVSTPGPTTTLSIASSSTVNSSIASSSTAKSSFTISLSTASSSIGSSSVGSSSVGSSSIGSSSIGSSSIGSSSIGSLFTATSLSTINLSTASLSTASSSIASSSPTTSLSTTSSSIAGSSTASSSIASLSTTISSSTIGLSTTGLSTAISSNTSLSVASSSVASSSVASSSVASSSVASSSTISLSITSLPTESSSIISLSTVSLSTIGLSTASSSIASSSIASSSTASLSSSFQSATTQSVDEPSASCLDLFAPGSKACITVNPTISVEPLPSSLPPVSSTAPYPKPRDPVCLNSEQGAPKKETTDGSISVADAIQGFCMKVNGEVLEKGGDNASVRMRFDVTGFGVLGRESMWVSASVANYDQCSSGKVDTGDCVNVLNNGLDFCNTDSIYTFGYTGQGENCVAYGVDVSSDMHDDNPPWQEAVDISYPPPENYFDEISCQYVDGSMPLREEDIQATIDDYCNIDGAFRPAGPDGWTSQGALDMEAAPNVDLAPEGDSRWCSDFDRNVNKDDCTYAIRKIVDHCGTNAQWLGWNYRCVNYALRTEFFAD